MANSAEEMENNDCLQFESFNVRVPSVFYLIDKIKGDQALQHYGCNIVHFCSH